LDALAAGTDHHRLYSELIFHGAFRGPLDFPEFVRTEEPSA
jgi:hypothetical protein